MRSTSATTRSCASRASADCAPAKRSPFAGAIWRSRAHARRWSRCGPHSAVPSRFLTQGETHRRPLKGRGEKAARRIPMPAELAARVAEHLERHVDTHPDALVFTVASGRRINLSNFHRDVWKDTRAKAFPKDSPLRQVRRHDLRHSAITAWLNAGVPLKTAQAWSAPDPLRPAGHLPRRHAWRRGTGAGSLRGRARSIKGGRQCPDLMTPP
ncbi:MAG: tyrosine-type recombinase/integrase [Nitriliruptorales bacterium]|nr:tyrosine-type recombinase/integrase [Nitriliruptorales bacterium]